MGILPNGEERCIIMECKLEWQAAALPRKRVQSTNEIKVTGYNAHELLLLKYHMFITAGSNLICKVIYSALLTVQKGL